MLRADDKRKSGGELVEDILTGKMGLALSAFGTIVSGWGKYLGWWSFSYQLVWAWFAFHHIYRDSIRLKKSDPGAAASDTSPGG